MNNWLIWVVKCWGNNSLLLSAMRYCFFRWHILRGVRMVCIYTLYTHKLHAGLHCVRSNRATIYSIFIRIYCSICNKRPYSHYDINARTSNEYRFFVFFSLSLSLSEYLGFVIDMCDLQWYIRQKFGWILDCCSRSAERRFLTLSHWTRVIRLNKKIKSAQKPKLQIYSASILYDYQFRRYMQCM